MKKVESFEDLDVYRLAENLGGRIWDLVVLWSEFERRSIGYQLVKSTDSIGANIAEGFGRFHFKENKQFVRISRGSLYETRHWLRRAYKRKLLKDNQIKELKELLEELAPRLNAYINSIGQRDSEKQPTALDK